MILSGNNTFSGNVIVSTGGLVVKSNTALGTAAGFTTVSPGAYLVLDGSAGNLNYTTAEPTFIAGSGVNSAGALQNVAGNNTYAGPITADTETTQFAVHFHYPGDVAKAQAAAWRARQADLVEQQVKARLGTSGPGPASWSTSTSRSWAASCDPGTASPATAAIASPTPAATASPAGSSST